MAAKDSLAANPSADVKSIEDKLSKISSGTANYGTVCIYKVPEKHRNKNPEAYAPKLVSVGFVHHGENQLQAMEEYKLRYLNDFKNTFQVSLEELVKFAKDEEERVCGCYEDISSFLEKQKQKQKTPSHEVILLDGVFVIELFLKNHFTELRENGDRMFDNSWVSNELLHDLLLFENQLPLKFLCTLYDKFVFQKLGALLDSTYIHPPSFYQLAHKYFKNVVNTGKLALTSDFGSARHFLEFLSILHNTDNKQNFEDDDMEQSSLSLSRCGWAGQLGISCLTKSGQLCGSCLTCIDPTRCCGVCCKKTKKDVDHVERKFGFKLCPATTRLKAAGVRFEKKTGSGFLAVDFGKEGVLRISPLTVNDFTETLFRNLIAFEQSGIHNKHATSVVILLDNLIDTAEDVDILIKCKILENELGTTKQVADLFNSLYNDFVPDPKEFVFAHVCHGLNDYSRGRFHKMNAVLIGWRISLGKHFNTPLTIAPFVLALILLALTVVQTAFSVRSVQLACPCT